MARRLNTMTAATGASKRSANLVGISLVWGMSFFLVSSSGRAATKDTEAAQIQEAFELGLKGLASGKSKLLLDVEQSGRHFMLTGYGQSGASLHRLVCLLCTSTEVRDAAAYFGDLLRRRVQNESPAQTGEAGSTTLSIDGAPVPAVSAAGEPPASADAPTSSVVSWRWAAVAAGLGAGTAAMGGVFLWMDGKCASDDCRDLHSLKGAGIGILVSAALLEAAAILLWRLGRRSEAR